MIDTINNLLVRRSEIQRIWGSRSCIADSADHAAQKNPHRNSPQQRMSFINSITRMFQSKSETQQVKVINPIYNYLLYTPSDSTTQRWPLLLFLHGMYELAKPGSDDHDNLEMLKNNGIPKMLEEDYQNKVFPFITVSPQTGYKQRFGWDAGKLHSLLLEVMQEHVDKIDTTRIYLTGLSMGAYGTWEMATEYPNLFAAIAPVCGGCDPAAAKKLKHLPIWNFHGAEDKVNPISESDKIINALKKEGASKVTYTVYPHTDHDCWTQTYANPELYKWLLSHHT